MMLTTGGLLVSKSPTLGETLHSIARMKLGGLRHRSLGEIARKTLVSSLVTLSSRGHIFILLFEYFIYPAPNIGFMLSGRILDIEKGWISGQPVHP